MTSNVSAQAKLLATALKAIHDRWSPHEGQLKIGRALFKDDIRKLFIQCGRKFGKSEISMYLLFRWAITAPNRGCYYIAPFKVQAREIIWRRILQFIPEQFIAKKSDGALDVVKGEMRINLVNGSFIKIDGSDNDQALRGITPDIVVYDEFKDFKPDFHIGMEPNLVPMNAPLIIIGTPPDHDCQYTQIATEYKMAADCRHFEMPTHINPHIDKELLAGIQRKLEDKGEQDVWEREYMGRYVKGGAHAIFPMFSKTKHVRPHSALMKEIANDRKKLSWHIVADPGTASCFAVLLAAVNPYNKKIYILGEIYETRMSETSVSKIWPRVMEKAEALFPQHRGIEEEFRPVADEAATWFRNEVQDRYDIFVEPTSKAQNKKEEGLSLIKDQLLAPGIINISSRCDKLAWEVENYIKDDKGKIPKENDHLIDCWRYLNAAFGYTPEMIPEPEAPDYPLDARERNVEMISLEKEAEQWALEEDAFKYY